MITGISAEIAKEIESFRQENNRPNKCTDIDRLLNHLRIAVTDDIPEPPTCMYITHEGEKYPLFTLGNFSAVIGKAKSKKTFMVSMALAAALKNDVILEKFAAKMPDAQPHVVLIDTEQSKFHVQKVIKRVCTLAGITRPENFDCYGLRSLTTKERINAVDLIIENTQNLGFVVIDGIKDLVGDINKPEEANDIVGRLLKWSEEKNIHICVVLHQNKNNDNARGHIGTEITNKAETVLSVTKEDQNSSSVKAEFCRDMEFPPFSFSVNQEGLPYTTNRVVSKNKAIEAYDLENEAHFGIIKEMYDGQDEISRGELLPLLINVFERKGSSMAEGRGKKFITRYIQEGWIALARSEGKYRYYKNMV